MDVKIVSAKQAADNVDYIKNNNIALISIRDTSPDVERDESYDKIDRAGIQNLYVANFDDLETELDPKYGYKEKPPEHQDIEGILTWTKQKMDEGISSFMVHCTAGVSRSSAVAILIKALHNPEEALKVINPLLHSPNMRVIDFGEKIIEKLNVADDIKKMEDDYREEFLNHYDQKWANPPLSPSE